jgi:hypothetical protein
MQTPFYHFIYVTHSPGTDNKLRTPRSHKRHSQMSQISQGSTEITKDPNDQEAYSFIPLVLDHSTDPSPAPILSTAHSRFEISRQNSNNSQSRYQERTSSRPPFERQLSNASSYHDARDTEKELPKSISETSDPSDEMQNGVGTGGGLTEQTADASGEKNGSERKASPALQKVNDQAKSINNFRAEGFKLGEVPRERRKPIAGLKPSDGGQESQASSPTDSIHTPTPLVPFNSNSAPLRQESFRHPPSRTDSPASINSSPNRKALGSPIHSISSSRSQHSHDTSRGSNSSAITAAESPQIFSTPNKTSYASVSHHGSPVSGHGNQTLSKPVLPRRPSSATEGNWSPPPSGSVRSEISPALPSPFKSPLGGLGFDEDLKRVFGGGEAVIRRVSNSIKHGRSLSEVTRQSPKIPKPSPYAEITSPIPLDGSREDTVTLKQELRRSTQRIAELEAKLNVSTLNNSF